MFEHLVHPHHLAKEIHRVLGKEGRLYAHVPNQFTLLDRLQIAGGRSMVVPRWFKGSHEWDFPHLRFFTQHGFRSFLHENGFEVMEEYSHLWSYSLPLGLTTQALSRIRPQLFSPGFTFICRKR